MSHGVSLNIDIEAAMDARPIQPSHAVVKVMWLCVFGGLATFLLTIFSNYPKDLFWGAFYTNVVFFMGLTAGSLMIPIIFQIVRAKWSPPVRRIAEANVGFLPWIYSLFLLTYFGKEHLFIWAKKPMPGREWWMEPDFVYERFAILLGILFWCMWRFVRNSLRGDIGLLRERSKSKDLWRGWIYKHLTANWKGSAKEIPELQVRMTYRAPVIVILYALIYSLFIFEMVLGMNEMWSSNLFGAFNFVGNIYLGWATVSMWAIYLVHRNVDYAKVISSQQLWDLGKLCLGFCMLWGYMFFSQFLVQWYGNLPEETQWLILRTREYPWKGWGWMTFSMCFIIPFILLFSEDLKRAMAPFSLTCMIVFFGIWAEKYITIMPEISPHAIPFGPVEIGLFLGFFGGYVLSIHSFLKKFPFLPISHPLTHGSQEW